MPEQLETKKTRVIRIGPDQVTVTDEAVIIEARREMPDWEVREFQPPPIYFEDKKYILAEKRKGQPPYSAGYVLWPWPADKIPNAKQFHNYDAEAVAERDSARQSEKRDEVVWICLLPLYPFLGLLWSSAQQRLTQFGFVPRTITGISIFTVFCLLFAQGVFAVVMINSSARSGQMMVGGLIRAMINQDHFQVGPVSVPVAILDFLLALAFLADVAIRYSCFLREHEWTGGFLEWMVPQSLRKP
jgi:hypothetical protein